jgi:hypothetical protein
MEKSEETKKGTEPKVVIFGNEVNGKDEECCKDENIRGRFHFRHHRRGSLTWGLFFILIGILFLLANFGALPPVVWSQLGRLWPVLIVFIGLDTLLGHSEISDIISSLISIAIFLTILGVILFKFSPQTINFLPAGILNYFHSVSNLVQLK